MTRAIQIHAYGGPEVLKYEEVALPRLGARQLRIRQTAIGLNFIDTYERTGLYAVQLPAVLGREAAGVVLEVGRDVTQFKAGDGWPTAATSRVPTRRHCPAQHPRT